MSRRWAVWVVGAWAQVALAAPQVFPPPLPPGAGGPVGQLPGPPPSQVPPSAGGGSGTPLTGLPRVVLGPGGHPIHGSVITESHLAYNAASQLLAVGGEVRGLANAAGWDVRVQGVSAGLGVGPTGILSFARSIDLHENQGPSVPFSQWLDDDNQPLIGVLAELVDPNGFVVDSDRIVFYDARYESGMRPTTPTGERIDGLGIQVSQSGATALAEVHHATMFYPSEADFRGDIAAAVADQPAYDLTVPLVCEPLSVGHPAVATAAYVEAEAAALGILAIYMGMAEGADACLALIPVGTPLVGGLLAAACEGGVQLARNDLCVKTSPLPGHFEVCTDGIRLETTDLTTGDVTGEALQFGAGETLVSTPTLSNLDATYTGTLEGLLVRWIDDGCSLRPKADLTEADLDAVADWRTCDDLEIDAASATGDLIYAIDAGKETLDVSYESGEFQAFPNNFYAGAGTCSEDWLVVTTDLALLANAGDIQDIVTDAWLRDEPQNDEAIALDLLLPPLEIGLQDPRLWRPELEWSDVRTDELDGLWLEATTDAVPGSGRGFEPTTWFQYVADPPPTWFLEGLDPDLEPFDVAFSVTTGWLNQIVRAGYGTGRLEDTTLRITRGDMGAATNTSQPVQLDGTMLAARVDPVFGEIGKSKVTLVIDGSMAPFTLMDRDPPNTPVGEYKVSYNAPQLYVTLASGADVWAVFTVDLHESDLLPGWDTSTQTVAFPLTDPGLGWTPVVWNFAGCKPLPYGLPSCAVTAVAELAEIANPAIERLLQSLIREVPAPRFFDSSGASTLRVDVEESATGTWRDRQTITIFGALEQ